jgi:F-type H+-transporting ATPase subunit gamma
MTALKDIKKKMRGISSTEKITSAMKKMSTARLGRAIEQKTLTSAYIFKLEQIVHNLRSHLPSNYCHPCIYPRPVKSAGFVVIGGERGLCGGFNLDLNRFAEKFIDETEAENKKLVVIGKKACKYFENCGFQTIFRPDLTIKNAPEELFSLSSELFRKFREGETDSQFLIYSSFVSPTRKFLAAPRLLPLEPPEIESPPTRKPVAEYDFYPSPTAIFDEIIPRYLRNLFLKAIIESSASEQSARMIAMTSATDRAQEIIEELELEYNRKRQALITSELAEVIAGADA